MQSKLIKSLRPLFYVSKLLGITYYSLENKKSGNLNLINILWSLPVHSFCIFSIYQGIANFNQTKYITADAIQISASICNVIARVMCNIYERNAIKRLILSITEKDELLNDTKYTNTFYWFIPLFFEVVFIILTDYFIGFSDNISKFNIFYYSNYALCFFIGIFETFFNYKILNAIGKQFAAVNRRLFKEIKNSKNFRSEKIISKITVAIDMHYELTMLTNNAIKTFGLMTMLTIASNIILITAKLFFLASSIITVWEIQQYNSSILTLSCWTTMLFINIFTIIKSWRIITQESKLTATYIHDIWNKYASGNKTDSSMNYLQLASVQLLNTNSQCTAYGVYPLDWTLMKTVAAAAATYVVILIQLEID